MGGADNKYKIACRWWFPAYYSHLRAGSSPCTSSHCRTLLYLTLLQQLTPYQPQTHIKLHLRAGSSHCRTLLSLTLCYSNLLHTNQTHIKLHLRAGSSHCRTLLYLTLCYSNLLYTNQTHIKLHFFEWKSYLQLQLYIQLTRWCYTIQDQIIKRIRRWGNSTNYLKGQWFTVPTPFTVLTH